MRYTRIPIIACLLMAIIAHPSIAFDRAVDSSFEFGRKGSSGQVDEEDLTDEFNYIKSTTKFSHTLDKTTAYNLRYQYYEKDFDTLENLENMFHSAGFGFDKTLPFQNGLLLKLGPDFDFKEKHYRNAANLDYDQIKAELPFTLKKEGDWTIRQSVGINWYDYPNATRDEFKTHERTDVSKKFLDERLEASAFYRLQWIERQKIANRFEKTYGASLDAKTGHDIVKNVEAGYEEGMDNTKTNEDREDTFDFKYRKWYVKTSHVLEKRVKTSVKCTYTDRVYADFNHGYDGFLIENNWSLRALETDAYTLDMKFGYLHKQFRFPYVSNPFSFHYNAVAPELELDVKNDWKLTLGSDVRFYDYPARDVNDKIYYIAKASIEKSLLKKALVIALDYKYTFKNFLHRIDITEDTFKLRATYKF